MSNDFKRFAKPSVGTSTGARSGRLYGTSRCGSTALNQSLSELL